MSMMIKRKYLPWLNLSLPMAISALLIALPAQAGMQDEVQHLIQHVTQMECRYERNGKTYAGPQAAEHMQTKYDYYRDDIDSAERFIELAASRSILSGRAYTIHCPGQKVVTSAEWLSAELQRYRSEQKPGAGEQELSDNAK